ncbi:hypothetical protein HD600_002526 [Microbacterium ginsengiterrae]|uniref:Uncharacterized protein n=1 Tax=Microbacterium ginsengiterrae TaxID=546115 RepID=A0A7W9FE63_9MICO|nr:hypothetical protein [Microbacterium ginsengiterrae]
MIIAPITASAAGYDASRVAHMSSFGFGIRRSARS